MREFLPQRKQIRLKEYNYSTEGLYFITICTKDRKHILSRITCRGRVPSLPENTKIGNIVQNVILYINEKQKNIKINEYIIMPNHIHMIINITGRDGTLPLQKIIGQLKSYTTKKYNENKKLNYKQLWQRNYYEHVIRNEKEYYKIVEYIQNNPFNWLQDKYYSNNL